MRTALISVLLALITSAHAAEDAAVVVLSTRGAQTEVHQAFIDRGGARTRLSKPRRLGRAIEHAHDGVVRGAVVDATTVFVTAEEDVGPDRSWSGALWRVSASGAERLCGRVAYASRPVVAGRTVYLQTGRAGASRARELREDEIEITEIDTNTGAARVLFTMRGQLAYPIDVLGNELLAYVVGSTAPGTLVAIPLSGGTPREIATLGVARDFVLRGSQVVYSTPTTPGRASFAVDCNDGHRERLELTDDSPRIVRATRGELSLVQQHAPGKLPQLFLHGSFGDIAWPATDGERIEPVGLR